MTDPGATECFQQRSLDRWQGISSLCSGATDAAVRPRTSRFPGPPPTGAPPLECLVRFGDTLTPGVFGNYRLWVSSTNVTRWEARENRSNEPVDTTFTYGDYRRFTPPECVTAVTGGPQVLTTIKPQLT
jgi:hypothetical protein